jgi:hypothetical protein
MRAALAGLDEGTFTEGHELDRKTTKQVPKAMIGRRCLKRKRRGYWLSSVCPRAGFGATVELIPAQAALVHRIWCRNPQRQTVTRPKGQHFQWLSSEKSLGSKPEQ